MTGWEIVNAAAMTLGYLSALGVGACVIAYAVFIGREQTSAYDDCDCAWCTDEEDVR